MPYFELDELRGSDGVLDQLDTSKDGMLSDIRDDVAAFVNAELGVTEELAAAATDTRTVYGDGTVWLTPPLFTAGSVTLVSGPSGYTVPDYVEVDGALRVTTSTGIYTDAPYPRLYPYGSRYLFSLDVWLLGVPYVVTADYGVSASDLQVLRRICLELAVQLYRFRDSGGSQQLSTEVAVITVKNTYSPIIAAQLGHLRQRVQPANAVVW